MIQLMMSMYLLYLGRFFIEVGHFKSKRVRSHVCQWSSSAFVRALKQQQQQQQSAPLTTTSMNFELSAGDQ
jgi:hypothetical protein